MSIKRNRNSCENSPLPRPSQLLLAFCRLFRRWQKGYLASFALLLLCAVLNWSCRPNVTSSAVTTAELQQTLEKCSSESEIQAEVDALFSRFGDKDNKSLYGAILSTTPALARFAKALSDDPLLDIAPNGYDDGVPAHVEIRFGTHSHYQFIVIFKTGSDLSSVRSPFEQVTNNVYLKP